MKRLGFVIGCICLLGACERDSVVRISGTLEGRDTALFIRMNGQEYALRPDPQFRFAVDVPLEKSTYASLEASHTPLVVPVFLIPGEDLEITAHAAPSSVSVSYRGALAPINAYLKEEGERLFVSREVYQFDERRFVDAMRELIRTKTLMLEAKNLGEEFTLYEKERIRYLVAERALFYSQLRPSSTLYAPNSPFGQFMEEFSLNNEYIEHAAVYRRYLNYYFWLKILHGAEIRQVAEEVMATVRHPQLRDWVLSEVLYRHISAHGLAELDFLLALGRREIKDADALSKVEGVADAWRRLTPGATAPAISLLDEEGRQTDLKAFSGSYLYIAVWPSWMVGAHNEMLLAWRRLTWQFEGKPIRFPVFYYPSSGEEAARFYQLCKENPVAGKWFRIEQGGLFRKQYILSEWPRYILINPEGRIVQATAPKPDSEEIRILFRQQGL